MELNNEFVEALESLGEKLTEPATIDVNGRQFSAVPLHEVKAEEHSFPTITLYSLDSLVDYVNENVDEQDMGKCQIVVGHAEANLVGQPAGVSRKRDVLVRVVANRTFRCGDYMPLEDFRVHLLTAYERTDQRDMILKLISNITDENIRNSQDDGVSQTVNARVGIATVGDVKVPSPVELRPLRTWAEIEQPECDFIFRLRKAQGAKASGVEGALFEIASNWQRVAAIGAQEYIGGKLGESVLVLA